MVAVAPNSGNMASTLARDWAFQVNTGDGEAPNWVFVRGLSQISVVTTPTMQDDSDIDSEGYKSQIATALELTIQGEGKRKGTKSADAFTQDPGQSALREKGRSMGMDNVVQVRVWRTDGVDEGHESFVSVQWEDQAGGNEDLDTFSFTCMSRGKPTAINPVEDAEGASVPVGAGSGE